MGLSGFAWWTLAVVGYAALMLLMWCLVAINADEDDADGVAVDAAPHPLLSAPTLYGRTGDVKDCNTLLVNRGELRAALGVNASDGGKTE